MTRRKPRTPEPDPSLDAGIGFGSPPPKKGPPKYDWSAIADKCRRKPGKWFQVFTQDKTTYYSAILQGSIRVLSREQGFEVRSANTKRPTDGPRTTDLWVRYVTEKDTTRGTQ